MGITATINQRQLNNSIRRDNQRAFADLIDVVHKHRPLAFVGADLSAQVGYPTWKRLLHMLHKAAYKTDNQALIQIGDSLEKIGDATFRAALYYEAPRSAAKIQP